ncbi:MAG TPA: hypothetical protein V6D10_20590 [Trichocoleus sp.]|jgi:hypothetical protein
MTLSEIIKTLSEKQIEVSESQLKAELPKLGIELDEINAETIDILADHFQTLSGNALAPIPTSAPAAVKRKGGSMTRSQRSKPPVTTARTAPSLPIPPETQELVLETLNGVEDSAQLLLGNTLAKIDSDAAMLARTLSNAPLIFSRLLQKKLEEAGNDGATSLTNFVDRSAEELESSRQRIQETIANQYREFGLDPAEFGISA